jgi:hypothetical protein
VILYPRKRSAVRAAYRAGSDEAVIPGGVH